MVLALDSFLFNSTQLSLTLTVEDSIGASFFRGGLHTLCTWNLHQHVPLSDKRAIYH